MEARAWRLGLGGQGLEARVWRPGLGGLGLEARAHRPGPTGQCLDARAKRDLQPTNKEEQIYRWTNKMYPALIRTSCLTNH